MTACFYIKQRRGEGTPKEVVTELKQKRHVVSTAVARYEVVQEFHAHVVRTHGNGKCDGAAGGEGASSKKGRGKAKAT